MTTDREALQKIFEAALKEPETSPKARATRPSSSNPAHPEGQGRVAMATATLPPPRRPIRKPCTEVVMPDPEQDLMADWPEAPDAIPAPSDKFSKQLDQKIAKDCKKRKRELLVTTLVAISVVGGGIGWFASSGDRVNALIGSLKEVRSVSDIKNMMSNYQQSLDKSSSRDQAALGAGTESTEGNGADMNAEMQNVTSDAGKISGNPAHAMPQNFSPAAEAESANIQQSQSLPQD